jgi:hypothetical protein
MIRSECAVRTLPGHAKILDLGRWHCLPDLCNSTPLQRERLHGHFLERWIVERKLGHLDLRTLLRYISTSGAAYNQSCTR